MLSFLFCLLLARPIDPPALEPFEAPKHGFKARFPKSWVVKERENAERIFVVLIPQADPDRPGVVACELGIAPESLNDYRTRIDLNAKRGGPVSASLVKNEISKTEKQERLETIWEFRPEKGAVWREVSVRVIANRQLYTYILNVDDPTYQKIRPDFDALIDTVELAPPNTGADLFDKKRNRWTQREFKFAIDLPEAWQPVLAPTTVALLFATGPASGVWSDNFLVLAKPFQNDDFQELAKELPEQLRVEEPGCEVIACEVVKHGEREALETIVKTTRGPFSMTVIERRFRGRRFDYEMKFTVESKRFEALLPFIRKSLESFEELPGDVPSASPRKTT